jgi:hypothetical protein
MGAERITGGSEAAREGLRATPATTLALRRSTATSKRPHPRGTRSAPVGLEVGRATDRYEREADVVAAAVIRGLHRSDNRDGAQVGAPMTSGSAQRTAGRIRPAAQRSLDPADTAAGSRSRRIQRMTTLTSIGANAGDVVGEHDSVLGLSRRVAAIDCRPVAGPVPSRGHQGSTVIQRKVNVHGVTITKHNLAAFTEGRLASSNRPLYEAWQALTGDEKARVTELIRADELHEGATFRDLLGPRVGQSAPVPQNAPQLVMAPTRTIQLGDTVVTLRVLNDSGGYHLILEHPTSPRLVVRQRRSRDATTIERGLVNMKQLSIELERRVGGRVRTPGVVQGSPDAYIVERVSGTADALAMWNRLKEIDKVSQEAEVLRRRLDAIRELIHANMSAMRAGKKEPFPDFRPSNIGVVDQRPELVYIDFDQEGEVKDERTLMDHIMEWAGRKYPRDPGGAREADPALLRYLTNQ